MTPLIFLSLSPFNISGSTTLIPLLFQSYQHIPTYDKLIVSSTNLTIYSKVHSDFRIRLYVSTLLYFIWISRSYHIKHIDTYMTYKNTRTSYISISILPFFILTIFTLLAKRTVKLLNRSQVTLWKLSKTRGFTIIST